MTTKMTKHPHASVAKKPGDSEAVSKRAQELQQEANDILIESEARLRALVTAMSERREEEVRNSDLIDEREQVLSPEDYEDFVELAEEINRVSTARSVALYLGLPEHIADPLFSAMFANIFGETTPSPKGGPAPAGYVKSVKGRK